MEHRIIKAIQEAKTFLIASHYHPDGDCLGSSLALKLGLQKLKKRAVVYNRDPVPFNLNFLPDVEKVTNTFPKESFDCAVMVDCAQPNRVSPEFASSLEAKKFGKLLCIDHHLLDHKIGDIDLIEKDAPSAGAVVWHLLKDLKLHPDKAIANLVYCTLTVDTGSFKYSNTTAEVFELAKELVQAGADPWLIARNLEESNPIQRFFLLQKSLASLSLSKDGLYASMEVSQKMLKESGAAEGLSDEFANIPRSIQGVEVAALFREMEEGRIKISLRSKLRVDVSKIAKHFGGGGHQHAAGCVLNMSLEEAKKRIEEEVFKHLKFYERHPRHR